MPIGNSSRHAVALTIAIVVSAMVAAACGDGVDSEPTPKDLLVAAIQRMTPNGSRDDSAALDRIAHSITIVSTRSGDVHGVTYHSGIYRPSESQALDLTALVAQSAHRSLVIRHVEDWVAVATDAGWRPTSAPDAERGCSELARYATPAQSHAQTPIIYHDPSDLREPIYGVAFDSAARIAARASRPAVTGDGHDWHVSLWAIEATRTTKYDCALRIGLFKRVSARLTAVDSIPGAGQQWHNP